MNILYLGPPSRVLDYLIERGENVFQDTDPVDVHFARGFEFIISYGYRHIITPDVIALFPRKIINLHISFLPWNRGADPNLWSWIDGTPKGVTIHHIDEGVDTGDIIVQTLVTMPRRQTLATSYNLLHEAIIDLFIANWWQIRRIRRRRKQRGPGSSHRLRDKECIDLPQGWDTPTNFLTQYEQSHRRNK